MVKIHLKVHGKIKIRIWDLVVHVSPMLLNSTEPILQRHISTLLNFQAKDEAMYIVANRSATTS